VIQTHLNKMTDNQYIFLFFNLSVSIINRRERRRHDVALLYVLHCLICLSDLFNVMTVTDI
jgi:hypothetical protein